MLTTGHKKRKKKKRQDLVFRFDCLQHGSGLPKISVGTMIGKKKKKDILVTKRGCIGEIQQ